MNIFELFKSLSNLNSKESNQLQNEIPKEISDQYPYGQFPIQYTKHGQETIRKQSENRFSYADNITDENKSKNNIANSPLSLLLPLIQTMSNNKKQPKDLMQIFGKLLFKDNPELQQLLSLMPKIKSQEINSNTTSNFPNTQKVNISSLKKID